MEKDHKKLFSQNKDEIEKIAGRVISLVYNNQLGDKSYIERQIEDILDESYERMIGKK